MILNLFSLNYFLFIYLDKRISFYLSHLVISHNLIFLIMRSHWYDHDHHVAQLISPAISVAYKKHQTINEMKAERNCGTRLSAALGRSNGRAERCIATTETNPLPYPTPWQTAVETNDTDLSPCLLPFSTPITPTCRYPKYDTENNKLGRFTYQSDGLFLSSTWPTEATIEPWPSCMSSYNTVNVIQPQIFQIWLFNTDTNKVLYCYVIHNSTFNFCNTNHESCVLCHEVLCYSFIIMSFTPRIASLLLCLLCHCIIPNA